MLSGFIRLQLVEAPGSWPQSHRAAWQSPRHLPTSNGKRWELSGIAARICGEGRGRGKKCSGQTCAGAGGLRQEARVRASAPAGRQWPARSAGLLLPLRVAVEEQIVQEVGELRFVVDLLEKLE